MKKRRKMQKNGQKCEKNRKKKEKRPKKSFSKKKKLSSAPPRSPKKRGISWDSIFKKCIIAMS